MSPNFLERLSERKYRSLVATYGECTSLSVGAVPTLFLRSHRCPRFVDGLVDGLSI